MARQSAARGCAWLHQGDARREIPRFHTILLTVTQQRGHLASHRALHVIKTNRYKYLGYK